MCCLSAEVVYGYVALVVSDGLLAPHRLCLTGARRTDIGRFGWRLAPTRHWLCFGRWVLVC